MNQTSSAAADEELPHAQNRLRLIAEASGWAISVAEEQEKSRRLAWRITACAVALAVLGWAMAAFLSSRPRPDPVVIVADRTTGETQIAGPFDREAIPALSVLDQHWAEAFVHACESYSFKALQRDYDQCARMSSTKVFLPYSAQFAGDDGKQNRIADKQEDTVSTISVRTSPSTAPGRHGEAVITFDKRVHSFDGTPDTTTRFVATCEFEYHPEAMKNPLDRLENPLGFLCTDYRKDAELLPPAPPVAPSRRNGGAT